MTIKQQQHNICWSKFTVVLERPDGGCTALNPSSLWRQDFCRGKVMCHPGRFRQNDRAGSGSGWSKSSFYAGQRPSSQFPSLTGGRRAVAPSYLRYYDRRFKNRHFSSSPSWLSALPVLLPRLKVISMYIG